MTTGNSVRLVVLILLQKYKSIQMLLQLKVSLMMKCQTLKYLKSELFLKIDLDEWHSNSKDYDIKNAQECSMVTI